MLAPGQSARRVLTEDDVQRLRRAAEAVLGRRRDVVAAYLYGSAARGEPAGDLDVAVLFRNDAPAAGELERMASELQHQGAPHGPEIDLRPLNRAAPRFRANVVSEGRVLFDADPDARLESEARALSEWLDFKPVWERMRARMRGRLARG